jgi:hypothetical protein
MASFIAEATGTTTCTIPAHQAKDRFIIYCLRDGSSSAPGAISGWQILDTSLANSCGSRIFTREVLEGETIGDPSSASATNMICLLYRPDSGKRLDIGTIVVGQFASGNWTYNAATFVQDNNTSWAVGVGGHRSGDTNMEAAPTGMTNRSNHAPGGNEASGHDTNGPVTGWSSQTITASGTSGASTTWVIELREEADGVMPRYLGFDFDTTDAAEHTFPDMPVGDSDDGTRYHMAISARFAGTTAITVTGVTCDGEAADIDVQVENSPTNGNLACLASIDCPAAATDIVVTFSGTVVRSWIQVYRGNGLLSDSATSTADAPTTTGVALSAGGYALASVATGAQPNVLTGTNMIAARSSTVEAASHHGSGYFAAVDDEAARAMTMTFSSALESVGAFAGYALPAATLTIPIAYHHLRTMHA